MDEQAAPWTAWPVRRLDQRLALAPVQHGGHPVAVGVVEEHVDTAGNGRVAERDRLMIAATDIGHRTSSDEPDGHGRAVVDRGLQPRDLLGRPSAHALGERQAFVREHRPGQEPQRAVVVKAVELAAQQVVGQRMAIRWNARRRSGRERGAARCSE